VRFVSSIGLNPVSLEIDIAVASFFDAFEIMALISVSKGIFGSFDGA